MGTGQIKLTTRLIPWEMWYMNKAARLLYRGGNKGLLVLLSRTQAGPGRTVKQEQEEISRNHVLAFIPGPVHYKIQTTPVNLSIF